MSVVLSGLPEIMTWQEIQYNLNKLFATTDDIGRYNIRYLPYPNERKVVLDFNSGFDAMYAQHLLDGKPYNLPNGDLKILRAKVTNDPEILADRSKTRLAIKPCSESSSSVEEDFQPSNMSSKQLQKANKEMDEQLKFIEKQKLLVMSENELLKQKLKLEKRINKVYKEEEMKKKRSALKKAVCISSDSETKQTIKKPRKKGSSSESESEDNEQKKKKKSKKAKKAKKRSSTPISITDISESDVESLDKMKSIKAQTKRDRSPSSYRSFPNEHRYRQESMGRSSRKVRLDSPPSSSRLMLKYRPREPSARRRSSSSEERSRGYRRRSRERSNGRHGRHYSDISHRYASDSYRTREPSARRRSSSSEERSRGCRRRSRERSNGRHGRNYSDISHRSASDSYRTREPSARRRSSSSEERSRGNRQRYRERSNGRHGRHYSDISHRSASDSYSNDIVYTSGSYPSRRAIEYRPNVSETYRAESKDRKRGESSASKIKEDETRKREEEERIRKQNQLKEKKYEAIKDIMSEFNKYLTELCVEYKICNDEKKGLLKNIFEIVNERMKTVGEDDEEIPIVTVSNLVLLYRCKYSKTEDKDLVGEMVQKLVSSRSTEMAEPADDLLFELDLDSILQELNLDLLTEDVKPKIEIIEEEDVNISIHLNPISSKDVSESMSQTVSGSIQENEDAEMATSHTAYQPDLDQYYINVKVDPKRRKKFFITTKRLIKDLRVYIKKYRGYLSHSVFRHVIQLIMEDRLEKIVVGQELMRARELQNFYRTIYPKSDDHEFIKKVIYDVYAGLYNEGEPAAEANPGDNIVVKEENEDLNSENVTTVIKQETTDNTNSIVKAEPCNNGNPVKEELDVPDNASATETNKGTEIVKKEKNRNAVSVKNEPISSKMDITDVVKTNARAIKDEEIEVVEPKVEVIDLSDTDEPINKDVTNKTPKDKRNTATSGSAGEEILEIDSSEGAQTGRQVTKSDVKVKENDIICLSDTENDAIVVSDDESSIDFKSQLTSKISFNSSHNQENAVIKVENQPEVFSKQNCSNNNTIDDTDKVDCNSSVDTLTLDTEDYNIEPNVKELDINDETNIVTADLNNPNSTVEAAARSKTDKDNAVVKQSNLM